MNKNLNDNQNYEIISLRTLPSLLSAEISNEAYNMTSLNDLYLLSNTELRYNNSINEKLFRISLAHEGLRNIPPIILQELAGQIKILDISYNEFENVDFLKYFTNLETLVCDHNKINSNTRFPRMDKLQFLWLNFCKITELYPWIKKLQNSAPNLINLSLMGNPAAPSYLTGGTFKEYLEYRYFILALFPSLLHLDDRPVTRKERQTSQVIYNRPVMDSIDANCCDKLPSCFKVVSNKIYNMLSPIAPIFLPPKNSII